MPNPLEALGAAAGSVLARTFLLDTDTATGIPQLLLVIDAVLEETPEYTADVTQHPVESGEEISDHVQLKNPTLKLRGTVSSSPIDLGVAVANLVAGGVSAFTSSQFRANLLNAGFSQIAGIAGAALQGASAVESQADALAGASDAIARAALLDAYQRKARFSVITKHWKYDSMVIQSLSFPRDQNTGRQVIFEVELIHLRVVSPLAIALGNLADGVTNSGSAISDLGNQAGGAVSDGIGGVASGAVA